MRTAKKVLGVVMAILMLINVVALCGFAADAPAMAADTVCQLYMVADKDAYAAGDDVVITVYAQTADDCPQVEMAGQYVINYDSSVFAPYSDSTDLSNHGFTPAADQAAGFDNSMSQVVFSSQLQANGETISAGDAIIGYYIAEESETFVDSVAAPVPLFSFTIKVNDGVADGTYTINFNEFSFMGDNYVGTVTDNVSYGLGADSTNSGTDWGFAETYMWSLVPLQITVGATGPAVAHKKAQVKMALNNEKTALAEVADPIQLRVTSVITAADFDAYFSETTEHNTSTASDKNAITSVGIVAYKGAAANFDEATAKALVTDGTAAANYAKAETDYISNVGGEYTFGAIIKGSRSDAFASDVTYLGFVKYLDASGNAQVIFYETAVTKTISDTTVSNYIAAQNA